MEQYHHYLKQNGFTSLESLSLLSISDNEYLNEISLGHLKLIIKTTKLFVQKNETIISQYKEYLQLLEELPSPMDYFPSIDEQISQYQVIKQKYSQNWSKQSELHSKITNILKLKPS